MVPKINALSKEWNENDDRKEGVKEEKMMCCGSLAASVINEYVIDCYWKVWCLHLHAKTVYWCFLFCVCQCFPFSQIRIRCFVWTQIKEVTQNTSVLWILRFLEWFFSRIGCLLFCLQNNSLQLPVGICVIEFKPIKPTVLKLFMKSHLLHETLAWLIGKSGNFSPIFNFLLYCHFNVGWNMFPI